MYKNNKNINTNNFLLGVPESNKRRNKKNNSNQVEINDVNNNYTIENTFIEKNKNKNHSTNQKIKIVVNDIVTKIEEDIHKLNHKVSSFNKEQKNIIDLKNTEIKKLKNIIQQLYTILLLIRKIEFLKNNSTQNRSIVLQKINDLKSILQKNNGMYKNINEILNTSTFSNINQQHEPVTIVSNLLQENIEKKKNLTKTKSLLNEINPYYLFSSPEPEKKNNVTTYRNQLSSKINHSVQNRPINNNEPDEEYEPEQELEQESEQESEQEPENSNRNNQHKHNLRNQNNRNNTNHNQNNRNNTNHNQFRESDTEQFNQNISSSRKRGKSFHLYKNKLYNKITEQKISNQIAKEKVKQYFD